MDSLGSSEPNTPGRGKVVELLHAIEIGARLVVCSFEAQRSEQQLPALARLSEGDLFDRLTPRGPTNLGSILDGYNELAPYEYRVNVARIIAVRDGLARDESPRLGTDAQETVRRKWAAVHIWTSTSDMFKAMKLFAGPWELSTPKSLAGEEGAHRVDQRREGRGGDAPSRGEPRRRGVGWALVWRMLWSGGIGKARVHDCLQAWLCVCFSSRKRVQDA